jgi:hypothetical protein
MDLILENSAREAAIDGDLYLLQSLKDHDYECLDSIAEIAAANNHPEILQWMIEEQINIDPITIMNLAVHYQFNDLLSWLGK